MHSQDQLYLLTTMTQYPAAYGAELRALTPAALTWKPSEREWSLAEVIAHLADCEEMYYRDRLLPILKSDRPRFPEVNVDKLAVERAYNSQDPMVNLARFAVANLAVVQLVWSVTPTDWERIGIHSKNGEMTFRRTVLGLANHHHSHLYQMRRVKNQYLRTGGRLSQGD